MLERHRAARTHTFKVAGKPRTIRLDTVSRPKIDEYYLTKALMQLVKEDVDGKLLKKALKAKGRNERKRR